MTPPPPKPSIPRALQFALFLTAMAWAAAATAISSRAASGISIRFSAGALEPLLESIFLLFLLIVGFRTLDWIAASGASAGEVLPLPKRPGFISEWGIGAAIGWGLSLAVVLPVLLTGHLHSQLALRASGTLTAVATLLVFCLVEEVIFRGYPYRRLAAAFGPSWAAVLLSIGFAFALIAGNPPRNTAIALLDGTLFGILLTLAWLRTHSLWLGWGLHFAYRAVTALILGLPIAGRNTFGAVTDTFTGGPRWLTGGDFGLDAALLTAPILVLTMVLLHRATRDLAWKYTLPEIHAAGYEVTIAPPAAHVAMEKAAAPPPLVQILPSTPQTFSRED